LRPIIESGDREIITGQKVLKRRGMSVNDRSVTIFACLLHEWLPVQIVLGVLLVR